MYRGIEKMLWKSVVFTDVCERERYTDTLRYLMNESDDCAQVSQEASRHKVALSSLRPRRCNQKVLHLL